VTPDGDDRLRLDYDQTTRLLRMLGALVAAEVTRVH
jgi:hypothetical protein